MTTQDGGGSGNGLTSVHHKPIDDAWIPLGAAAGGLSNESKLFDVTTCSIH
jgi:hypothetical protein